MKPNTINIHNEKRKIIFIWGGYFIVMLALFFMSFEKQALHGYNLRPGIIIGGLFPILTMLYYFRHYFGNLKSDNRTIWRWLFPAIFIHTITIFGFMITLSAPIKYHYQGPMFTAFYEYGEVFKSFKSSLLKNNDNTLGNDSLEDTEKYMKKNDTTDNYRRLTESYSPFFKEKIFEKTNKNSEFRNLVRSINAIPFNIAFAFSFLGALIFCLRDGIKRFNNVDLYPKIYVFYSVRFIVSCSLSAALSHFILNKWPTALGPIVFFIIGYFPERVISFLDDKMNKILGIRKTAHKLIPLSLVQGLSAEKAMKLREIGIEDIQNLAVANIEKMRSNLPYSKAMLCDWIGQSILILYFFDDIEKLRKAGVRTILDLQECVSTSDEIMCKNCAQIIGIKSVQLQYVGQILQLEHMIIRMDELRKCLSGEYTHRLHRCYYESEKIEGIFQDEVATPVYHSKISPSTNTNLKGKGHLILRK